MNPVFDRRILLAFAGVVLLAGSNIVAVRFSNRELDPFWGAGIRFLGASLILWALVARGHHPLPRGRALGGALVYGLLSFLIAYAFFYWGSQEVPAGLGGTIMASVPLLTVMLAAAHRLEPLRLRACLRRGRRSGGYRGDVVGRARRRRLRDLGARDRRGRDRRGGVRRSS